MLGSTPGFLRFSLCMSQSVGARLRPAAYIVGEMLLPLDLRRSDHLRDF